MRLQLIICVALLSAMPAVAQTPLTDSQTLEAILTEIRQFHHDVQAAAANTAQTQIEITRLQIQSAVVVRATQRTNEVEDRLLHIQADYKRVQADLRRTQNDLEQSQDDSAKKSLQKEILASQAGLDHLAVDVQEAQTTESEAAAELQAERIKLNEVQDRLNRLEDELRRSKPAQRAQ